MRKYKPCVKIFYFHLSWSRGARDAAQRAFAERAGDDVDNDAMADAIAGDAESSDEEAATALPARQPPRASTRANKGVPRAR